MQCFDANAYAECCADTWLCVLCAFPHVSLVMEASWSSSKRRRINRYNVRIRTIQLVGRGVHDQPPVMAGYIHVI